MEDILDDVAIKSVAAMLNTYTKENSLRLDLIDMVRRSRSLEELTEALGIAEREAMSLELKKLQVWRPDATHIQRVLNLAHKNFKLVKNLIVSYALSSYVKVMEDEK